MSFNFAYGPIDVFNGIDFSNLLEWFAENRPYLDPNIDNKPPVDERPNAPVGIPIEYFIAGITGKPVLGPDGNIIEPTPPPAAAGPATAPEGIETLPPAAAPAAAPVATPEPETGIASLNNSMVFERMRALARQPRDYKSYIG
jgi:hypothetical protein